jgi:hypothetical protein
MFSDLTDHVSDVVESLGDFGVAILVAIENLVPPIPSEIVLPLAGFVAGRGDANYLAWWSRRRSVRWSGRGRCTASRPPSDRCTSMRS